ncbi:MAG: hypothetical protein NVS4B1_19500 [Ktedonobacteraceae bacterium]
MVEDTTYSTAPDRQPPRPQVNPITTRAAWEAQHQAAEENLGSFHSAIAKCQIHWFDQQLQAWITWNEDQQCWLGLDARTGTNVPVEYPAEHEPWQRAFNDDEPPFYRWFEGGLTNACFNEVDRHVLNGYGDEVAFYFEGDQWDPLANSGRGGPLVAFSITRKQLLFEVVKAALVLRGLGLRQSDRIALNMPNIMEQIYYIEAAKRLGVIYTSVFGGFSAKTLSDRIHDAGARVVITSDGGYRNGQVIPFKQAYVDNALDHYIPAEVAQRVVEQKLKELGVEYTRSEEVRRIVQENLASEITLEPTDVIRAVEQALNQFMDMPDGEKTRIHTTIAQGLAELPPKVNAVIVVRHTGQQEIVFHDRDRWSHELQAHALDQLLAQAQTVGVNVSSEQELLALPTPEFIKVLYAMCPTTPVDADFPLFIIYTSGSTGKPKGVVHVHGGYIVGIASTMGISFDAKPGDVMYVIADPGWITGQSYMISAALTTRITSIVAEGSPVYPNTGRYASIIERYKVNIFKAGVTFLKTVMISPQNVSEVQQYDMHTLRICTFCAEPTNPSVQQFGMDLMCPEYINSYWATEHGGIVWTHFYGNVDFPLHADAHTYPLPWIFGDVWIATDEGTGSGIRQHYRSTELEERGEIVITKPYPYLARTLWGDVEHVGHLGWKGDGERYASTYWTRWADTWAYTQGDFAQKYADGSFSLHGRSDEVINVSGHRLGTEEVEGAILRDKQTNPDSPVGNVIVVGAPHRQKGLTPLAFVLTVPGRHLTREDEHRLANLVRQEKGVVAVPSDFIEVAAFPETRSGKYMRRFLRNLILGEPLGDTTTLRNPESLLEIKRKIEQWRQKDSH